MPTCSPTSTSATGRYEKRLGPENYARRREREDAHLLGKVGQGHGPWALEQRLPVNATISLIFKCMGLYGRGLRNFLDLRVVENTLYFPHLPEAFDGFRLLQIADIHGDLHHQLEDRVIAMLEGLEYDLAVNTGDFINVTNDLAKSDLGPCLRIAKALSTPYYCIPGNHDFLVHFPEMEANGHRFLLNESIPISRGSDTIYLSGIDDDRYYESDDIPRARAMVPEGAFSILLSHTPQTYAEAAAAGYDLMLSGHTHGGQICLPNGRAVVTHTRCPAEMIAGPWRYQTLTGYTSRGTGGGGAPLRFNCPPELTLHVFRQSK